MALGTGMLAEGLPLVGAGGEPVNLRRTFASHGVASLPPMRLDETAWTFEATLSPHGFGPRTVRVSEGAPGYATVEVLGPEPGPGEEAALLAAVAHVLRLDEDLSPFYRVAAADPDLAWAITGAGRMVRSPSVFEEVVKTICTTNCAWSATVRMVGALVEHLGEKAPGAPETGPYGRAFPTPRAMAGAGEAFYKEVVRAGYRGRYMISLSRSVAEGSVDLEYLGTATADDLSDSEVERRLLALPGVGPYAAAHVMTMLGRYSRPILDSWTRPTYARLSGNPSGNPAGSPVTDEDILARFRPYGPYAGLAFWLFLTRGWVEDQTSSPSHWTP